MFPCPASVLLDDDVGTKPQGAFGDFVTVLLALSVLARGTVVGG
jgi:hypothetical protein